MLKPIPPRDNSEAEKARYQKDVLSYQQNPERWGRAREIRPPARPDGQGTPPSSSTVSNDMVKELNSLRGENAELREQLENIAKVPDEALILTREDLMLMDKKALDALGSGLPGRSLEIDGRRSKETIVDMILDPFYGAENDDDDGESQPEF